MNDFMEFARYENWAATYKSPFEKWAERVEKLLGHDLDGDQEMDGYSLDFALVFFERGGTPQEYVASLRRA